MIEDLTSKTKFTQKKHDMRKNIECGKANEKEAFSLDQVKGAYRTGPL